MNLPPASLAAEIAAELGQEKRLWTASPTPWGYARHRWKTALAGVPFTAFAIFWTWGAAGGMGNEEVVPGFFVPFGGAFICVGLAMLLSPVFAAWKATRVYYAVTEKRAVIFGKVWRVEIHSFEAASLGGFERRSHGEAAGDIVFQRNVERRGKGTQGWRTFDRPRTRFAG